MEDTDAVLQTESYWSCHRSRDSASGGRLV